MIDFKLPPALIELRDRVRRFVETEIIPYERDPRITAHGPNEELRSELVDKAKRAGLLTIQAPKSFGGMELSHIEQAVVYEASGWSILGPVAMNCAAPDEANMAMLAKIASREHQEQWLRPLIEGRFRSCLAMTEPFGAGSDPSQLATTARRDGDRFSIDGHKWLISGAHNSGVIIIMAKVPDDGSGSPSGPTMFITPTQTAGIIVERVMNTIDRNFVEGHSVVRFENLTLPASCVVGEVGKALRYAQIRLVPARLTHAMRWLGAAERAQSIATEYAKKRTSFGKPVGEHQGVGFLLADNAIELYQTRLTILHNAWLLDQGDQARVESSIAKVSTAEALFRVADRCVQILGGQGISDETVVQWIYRDMRPFRLYDGPSEVHRFAIARQLLREPR
jgi:acyl-CoA dehydrogenase